MVDPEGDPGQRHNEDRGKVGLEDEEANVPAQLEREREALVRPGRQLDLALVRRPLLDAELRQLGVAHAHHGVLPPVHDHVGHRVAV